MPPRSDVPACNFPRACHHVRRFRGARDKHPPANGGRAFASLTHLGAACRGLVGGLRFVRRSSLVPHGDPSLLGHMTSTRVSAPLSLALSPLLLSPARSAFHLPPFVPQHPSPLTCSPAPSAAAAMAVPEAEKAQYDGSPHDSDHSPVGDTPGRHFSVTSINQNELHRSLKGRHMQMIAMCVAKPPPSSSIPNADDRVAAAPSVPVSSSVPGVLSSVAGRRPSSSASWPSAS